MLCAKFGWNWPSGSGVEDENVKFYRWTDRDEQLGRQTQDRREGISKTNSDELYVKTLQSNFQLLYIF